MSFEKFFRAIAEAFPADPLRGRAAELARVDPAKISVENVRALLRVSRPRAQRICDDAVRSGVFERVFAAVCPDGSVAATAATAEALPRTVCCYEIVDGCREEVRVDTADLEKRIYYRLAKRTDGTTRTRGPNSRTA